MRQIDKATATDRHSLDSAPDDLLVHRTRAGDDHAFELLFTRYHREVGAFVRSQMQRDIQEAEDVTSDVFTKVFRFLDRYQTGSFRGWLYQIARNTVIDHYRRLHAESSIDQIGEIVSPAIALDEHAIALEARTNLLKALDTLPPVPRRIVELRLKGFGLPDICADLGMELSAVKSAQHRAFAKLRIELRGVGIGVTEETSERS